MSVERYSVADILVNTGHTLSCQWYSGDTVVDPGTVTVTITDADGTAVVTAGATSGATTAPRTYTLTPAQNASLTTYTAVWTSAGDGDAAVVANSQVTTYAEVVGDLLFGLYEARQFDGAALSNQTIYTDADLIEFRALIADEFANRLGYPAGRRYKRVVVNGNGDDELLITGPDGESIIYLSSIRSISYRTSGTSTWTAYTATELADVLVEPWGRITRETLGTFAAGRQNIRIGFEHGMTSQHRKWPEINRAAKLVLRDLIVKSNIDDRATSFSDEFGSRTFVVTAGIRGAMFSIPEVNAIFAEVAERIPAVG